MDPSIATSNTNDNDDDDYEQKNSQLPDVEEYKASVSHRSPTGGILAGFKNSSPRTKGVDPPESATVATQQEPDEHYKDIEEDQHHPEPQDNKDEQSLNDPDRCFWKACALFSMTLLALIIALVVVLIQDDSNAKTPLEALFHWVHGDTDRYLAIRDYIENTAQLSDTFDSPSSPQYLAAQWMAHGDELRLGVPDPSLPLDKEFVERYALAVFFFAMEGSTKWKNKFNFLSGDHVCTWNAEFDLADGSSRYYGVHDCKTDPVDSRLYPRKIYMPNNGLNGYIPKEISGLYGLQYLSLEFNSGVVGTIPNTMTELAGTLNHLALQWCNLDGVIPKWLGNEMTNLKYLGLGNNLLDGTVPSEIGLLKRLELLGLDDNDLYGDIEIFKPLTNLKSLYLETNFFTGQVDDALMQSWPNLEEFDVSGCNLSGELSSSVFNHQPSLKVVDLHGNYFTGPLPHTINENFVLEFLAFHNNNFTGIVPDTFTNFKALRHLDISDNQLGSTLPEKFGELTTLEYLFTGTNNFVPGELPKFLIELTNLQELSMKKNHLQGSIPPIIGYLSNLRFLDFHDNQLTNEIPDDFGQLTALRHLILKQNLLSGQIPSAFKKLTNLEVLLMEQNRFEGNASPICSSTALKRGGSFVADCEESKGEGNTTVVGKIECSCCTMCCKVNDTGCNDWEWKGNLNPIWEYGFKRKRYSYDLGPYTWMP